MIRPAEIDVFAHLTPHSEVTVQSLAPLVILSAGDGKTPAPLLNVSPNAARRIAAGLLEAADLAERGSVGRLARALSKSTWLEAVRMAEQEASK